MKTEASRNRFIALMILSVVALGGYFGSPPAIAASPQEQLVAQARETVANFHFDPGLDWFHRNVKKA